MVAGRGTFFHVLWWWPGAPGSRAAERANLGRNMERCGKLRWWKLNRSGRLATMRRLKLASGRGYFFAQVSSQSSLANLGHPAW